MRQQQLQWSAKNIFCKQKSIDDKAQTSDSSRGKKVLRKQLSVDHVTSSIKHATQNDCSSISSSSGGSSDSLKSLLWQNATPSFNDTPLGLRVISTSAIKNRAQFSANSANSSINK
jgi:hypothetical protein